MSKEKFCPTHGPYDDRQRACPYCKTGAALPPPPRPLDARFALSGGDEEDLTLPPKRRQSAEWSEEDGMSAPPKPGGGAGKPAKAPGEPKGSRSDLDETVLPNRVSHVAGYSGQMGLMGWLIIKNGPKRGVVFPLSRSVILGRRNADLIMEDRKVSSVHAKVVLQGGHFVVTDVLSENGTYVNGERITQETALRQDDEITVGDTVLVLKTLEP